MFSWKRSKEVPESNPEELLNPKFFKLLRLDIEKQDELFYIYMKIKGSAPNYSEAMEMELWKVIELRKILTKDVQVEDMIQVCHIVTDYSYKKLVNMRIYDLTKIYKFALEGIEEIGKLEKKLVSKLRAKDFKAGIAKMDKFSDLIGLKTVADYYNEKLEDAENRPYSQCFSVWLLKKEQSEIDNEYIKQSTSDGR